MIDVNRKTRLAAAATLGLASVLADLVLATPAALPGYIAVCWIAGVPDRPNWRHAPLLLTVAACLAAGIVLALDDRPASWALRATSLPVAALPSLRVLWRLRGDRNERASLASLYRTRYEFAPIPMTEEDWSAAHRGITALRRGGVTDLRRHLDENPDLVRELAAGAVICDVNPAAVATYRAPDRDSLIAHFNDVDDYDGAGPTAEIFKAILCGFAAGERVVTVEGPDTTMDGRPIHLRSATMVVPGTAEPWSFVMQSVEDISDIKEAEKRLRVSLEEATWANEAKSEFLAAMSHEMRTPLNAIIGFATIMGDEMLGRLGNPRYREYAHDIIDSGHHMLRLTGDLLDISRIEAGHLPLQYEEVSLEHLVRACLRLTAGQARDAGVTLETHVDDGLGSIVGDERRLRQILINLLGNALKFTPKGGRVTLRVTARSDDIAIVVSDTGVGMADDDLKRVVLPFMQSGRYMAQHADGSGLGLALTQSLVEMHGGTMALESRLGQGTRVTVTLPRHPRA